MLEELLGAAGVFLAVLFSVGLGAILNLRSDLKEANEMLEVREEQINRLKERYGDNEKDISYWKKLAHELADEAHRNGAIAEGLAEDLAALKAYDPEEIEEKLRKIREIRAEEERIRQMRATGTLGLGGRVIWDGQRWVPFALQVDDGRVSSKDFTDALAQMTNAYGTTLWADNRAVMTIRN